VGVTAFHSAPKRDYVSVALSVRPFFKDRPRLAPGASLCAVWTFLSERWLGIRSGRPSSRRPKYTPTHALPPDEGDAQRDREQRDAHRGLLSAAAAALANVLRQRTYTRQPVRETRQVHPVYVSD
jgi:hypothetical protein